MGKIAHAHEKVTGFISWVPKSLHMVSAEKPRQHIKKQTHHIADKGPCSQSYCFSVVKHGCESWAVKKAESQGIDAFELWYRRRFLRVPWNARRSNHSILKEINPEYSLEGLMLKWKLHYFSHLMRRVNSLKKTDAGKYWRRQWQPTPVLLSGKSHGWRSLVGCNPWGR